MLLLWINFRSIANYFYGCVQYNYTCLRNGSHKNTSAAFGFSSYTEKMFGFKTLAVQYNKHTDIYKYKYNRPDYFLI